MKKLAGIMIIAMSLMLSQGSTWANSDRQFQTVTITSSNTLALTPPANVKYVLIDPTASDAAFLKEVIPDEQVVTLTGNAFTQPSGPNGLALITVGLLNDMSASNMTLILDSIRIAKLSGDAGFKVKLGFGNPPILLSTGQEDYAIADGDIATTKGAIRGTHKLVVSKTGAVAPGDYDFIIVWTGYDA